MCQDGSAVYQRSNKIDVRIVGRIVFKMVADLQKQGVGVGSVLQMVAVGLAGLEPGRVTGAKGLFAIVSRENDLTGQNIDKLVASQVPVALR